ncbi:MAG: hypothetical protein AAGB11_08120 [Pseudomonadota bacterium]
MSFGGRLGKAVGNIFLALINATLILVILAAIAVGYAVRSIDEFASTGARGIAQQALSAADIDPNRLEDNLTGIKDELASLRQVLAQRTDDGQANARLDDIDNRLREVHSKLGELTEIEITIEPATLSAVEQAVSTVLRNAVDAARPVLPAPSGEAPQTSTPQ